MEELVEILIRLIAALFTNRSAGPVPPRSVTPPGFQGAPAQPGRIEPPNRAVMTKKMPTAARPQPAAAQARPPVRKGARRAPASVAVAKPIVTRTAPAVPVQTPSPPPMAVAKAVAIKAAAAPNTLPPLTAVSIKKWLNPTTLRQQFMLTEVLQPPLALRNQSDPNGLNR
jgi:hypothetical protein